jgi:pimeloyl-ACP methyl ester carboxylesterase
VHGELAELLSTDFTVFNYDRRGRGDSGDTQPYAAQREIEDIEALIHAAGGSAAVFGNSSGAVLALRAAAKLPMTGLALWEPPFFTDPDAPRRAKAYLSQLSEELAACRPGDAMELFLASVGVPEGAIAGMRHSPGWPSMEAIAPTLLYDALVMGDSTIPAELESVAIPTLILTGSETGAWADGSARALMTVLPNAEHRVLEGQTHAVAWDVLASALKGTSVWRPVGP